MPDITMCEDQSCPMNGKCYRYLAIPSAYLQSFFINSPRENEKCDYFLAIKKGQRVNDKKICDEKPQTS